MPEPSTFRPITDSVKQAVREVGSQMKGLGDDITGKIKQTFSEEMDEVISLGENLFGRVKQVFAPFLSSIGQWFLQTKFGKSTSEYLKKILGIESRREKRERMGQGLSPKSLLDKILPFLSTAVGMFASGLGMLLGGILAPLVGPITEPFRVLAKTWGVIKESKGWKRFAQFMKDPFGLGDFKSSKSPMIKRILDWFKGLTKFIPESLLKNAEKGMKAFKKVFGWMGKVGSFVMKSFSAGFMKGFMKSINKIFWPIQIIMSVIDFIKGFQESEGDILDKIMGGVQNVLREFFGFPVKVFGMLLDWVTKQFGFENLGIQEKLTGFFDFVLNIPFTLMKMIKDGWKMILTKGWELASGKIDASSIFTSIFDYFSKIKDAIIAGLWTMIDNHPWLKKIISGVGGGELLKSLEETAMATKDREMSEYEQEQLKLQRENNKKLDQINQKALGNKNVVATSPPSRSERMIPDKTAVGRWGNSGAEADLD